MVDQLLIFEQMNEFILINIFVNHIISNYTNIKLKTLFLEKINMAVFTEANCTLAKLITNEPSQLSEIQLNSEILSIREREKQFRCKLKTKHKTKNRFDFNFIHLKLQHF